MAYRVEFAASVEKDLKKLSHDATKRVLTVIRERIAPNPQSGTRMKGKYRRLWRYRTGPYRIIYTIEHDRLLILVLKISRRKNAYEGLSSSTE